MKSIISEQLASSTHHFKFKVCLLGGTELLKNEFQKNMSSNCLPVENKQNIGVNISKIDYIQNSQKFAFYLWNLDCNERWAFLRTTFYPGSQAMIIFISEIYVDQIQNYLEEIKLMMPVIQVIFCVILEKYTEEDICEACLKNEEFKEFLETNNIELNYISKPIEMFEQISSNFAETRNQEDNFIIDFIPINALIKHVAIDDVCNEYFEPANLRVNNSRRANTQLIKKYLYELGFEFNNESTDRLNIINKEFGTFSIFLRNGKVSFTPRMCKSCKQVKNCLKHNKVPFPLCIEQETNGWSNLKGFGQIELLVISKILALKVGILPESIIEQIKKISCEKNK